MYVCVCMYVYACMCMYVYITVIYTIYRLLSEYIAIYIVIKLYDDHYITQ